MIGFDYSRLGSIVAEVTYGPLGRDDLRCYAEASGDMNPLHLDPEFARAAGFDDVIVHGMLGMALLGRMVSEAFPDHRMTRFSARFRSIIPVGREIRCLARLKRLGDIGAELELLGLSDEGETYLQGIAIVAQSVGD